MNERKSIVADSIKFGFRALYEHILLFVMVILTSIGIISFSGLGLFLLFLQFGWLFSVLHIGVIVAFFFLFCLIVGTFFSGIWLGLNRIALELYDDDKSSVRQFLSCFRLAPKAFGAGIIYFVAVGLGSLLFVIPGIFLAIRFSLFSYFIVDQTVGPIESLKMSYKTTKKHGWQLFIVRVTMYLMASIPAWCGAFLVFIGMSIPSLALSFVYGFSIIATIPLSFLVYAYFYRTLVPKNSYSE